jgi:hypothetical protein
MFGGEIKLSENTIPQSLHDAVRSQATIISSFEAVTERFDVLGP